MTIFAGVVCLDQRRALPQHFSDVLAESLSRYPGEKPRLFTGRGYALAHADLGLVEGEGVHRDSAGRVSLLAGEPLLHGVAGSRSEHVRELHESWIRRDACALRSATGAFSTAHFDPASGSIRLATDALGLRPLRFAIDDGLLVFGTSLRVMLRLLPHLASRPDLTGQVQLAAMGYLIGARTPYECVRSVEAGRMWQFGSEGARSEVWFRWDDIEETHSSEADFAARLHEAFSDAVRRRLRGDRSVVAQLSGGLDSRCVAASLRASQAEVHSINFAPEGSADRVLGEMSARALGTRHFGSSGSDEFWGDMLIAHAQWLRSVGDSTRPRLPSRIWTGFGGGDVVAPSNMPEALVPAMRNGRIDEAIDRYSARVGARLSGRLFLHHRRREVAACQRESIREALAEHHCADPARSFHVFLLLSEMRGNLALHHEEIDLRRFEFVMPFCDTRFVSLMLSWPLERSLRHRFYHRWLESFPSQVRATAWQAYPWSEPCPIPIPKGLRLQWTEGWYGRDERRRALRRNLDETAVALEDPRFPHGLLHRRNLGIAYLLARSGITRYMHLLDAARVFVRYAARPEAK